MSVSTRFRRSSARTSPLQVAIAIVALVLCLLALVHIHRGTAIAAASAPTAATSDGPVKIDVRVVRP